MSKKGIIYGYKPLTPLNSDIPPSKPATRNPTESAKRRRKQELEKRRIEKGRAAAHTTTECRGCGGTGRMVVPKLHSTTMTYMIKLSGMRQEYVYRLLSKNTTTPRTNISLQQLLWLREAMEIATGLKVSLDVVVDMIRNRKPPRISERIHCKTATILLKRDDDE